MGRYVIRRILQFIPVLFATLFLLHYLSALSMQIQGSPIRAIFGERPPPPSVVETLEKEYNLDDPCLRRTGDPCFGVFATRMQDYFTGDFGVDYQGQPVMDSIRDRLPVTARLAGMAILVEMILGIFLGVVAGLRKDKLLDNLIRAATVFIISFPIFVVGVLAQSFIGLKIGKPLRDSEAVPEWFGQMFTLTYELDYPVMSLVLPAFVLGSFSLAAVARLTRTNLIENIRSDYVRTARAKGLSASRVVGVHTLRNSLIPVVTYLGIDLGFLMGGSLITEGIFAIPGVGQLVIVAIQGNDMSIVIGVITLLVMMFMLISLLVDLLYAVLDPRIRYE